MHAAGSRQTTAKVEYGYTKVTIEKLFRVNGKSAQLKGLSPDIHIPDIYEASPYRESSLPFVLSSDSTSKKITILH
jgi:carboxyl-terminal processing protease